MSPEHLPVLSSDVRRRILDHLNVVADRAAPGESMGRSAADLAEFLGLHVTTVRFHLDQLVTAGFLVTAFERTPRVGRPGSCMPPRASTPAPRPRPSGTTRCSPPCWRRAGPRTGASRSAPRRPGAAGPPRTPTPSAPPRPRDDTGSLAGQGRRHGRPARALGLHPGAGDLQRWSHRDHRPAQLPLPRAGQGASRRRVRRPPGPHRRRARQRRRARRPHRGASLRRTDPVPGQGQHRHPFITTASALEGEIR